MNTFNRTTTCIVISAALLLGGCANTGSSLLSGTKPDPRLTTTEQSQFFSASGAQGCGVGAVSGAALGALVGALAGDSKKALAGAAIGGAAGCAAGMTANYYLDRLRKDYASTADRLQAMDNDISKDTAAVEKSTLAMKQVISENQATLTKISIQKDKAGFDMILTRHIQTVFVSTLVLSVGSGIPSARGIPGRCADGFHCNARSPLQDYAMPFLHSVSA